VPLGRTRRSSFTLFAAVRAPVHGLITHLFVRCRYSARSCRWRGTGQTLALGTHICHLPPLYRLQHICHLVFAPRSSQAHPLARGLCGPLYVSPLPRAFRACLCASLTHTSPLWNARMPLSRLLARTVFVLPRLSALNTLFAAPRAPLLASILACAAASLRSRAATHLCLTPSRLINLTSSLRGPYHIFHCLDASLLTKTRACPVYHCISALFAWADRLLEASIHFHNINIFASVISTRLSSLSTLKTSALCPSLETLLLIASSHILLLSAIIMLHTSLSRCKVPHQVTLARMPPLVCILGCAHAYTYLLRRASSSLYSFILCLMCSCLFAQGYAFVCTPSRRLPRGLLLHRGYQALLPDAAHRLVLHRLMTSPH